MQTSGITNKTDRSDGSADEDKRASLQRLTRRAFLGSSAVAGTGVMLTAPLLRNTPSEARTVILADHSDAHDAHSANAHSMGTVGTIGEDRQPVRPMHFLGAFNETEKTDRSDGSADEDKRASLQRLTRRAFLGSSAVAGTGVMLTAPLLRNTPSEARTVILADHSDAHDAHSANAHSMGTVGTIGEDRQPVRPMHFLGAFNETEFPGLPSDFHMETKLPNGTRLHEYFFIASDKEIEIAPGVYFPAWTYNGQVPGPTLRATKGDRIRIWFINEGSHPHTLQW